MEDLEAKAPFDDYPAFIGVCFLTNWVLFLRMWKTKFGRMGLFACVVGFPISFTITLLGGVGGWAVLGFFGILLFGWPIYLPLTIVFITVFITFAPIGLVVGALLLFGYEGYGFLRNGTWNLHTLLDFDPLLEWVRDRRDWVGLKKMADFILSYLPLWVVMLIASYWIASASADTLDEYQNLRRNYLKLRGKPSQKRDGHRL